MEINSSIILFCVWVTKSAIRVDRANSIYSNLLYRYQLLVSTQRANKMTGRWIRSSDHSTIMTSLLHFYPSLTGQTTEQMYVFYSRKKAI